MGRAERTLQREPGSGPPQADGHPLQLSGFKKCVLILVFDAYRVPGSPGSIEQYHNIHVVYTREAETADMFIERVTHEIGKGRRVRVATSDGMEQVIILGHGALRVSARMFHEEVQEAEKEIRRYLQGEG